MEIDFSLSSERVVRALEQIIERCGRSQQIRYDNGSKYIIAKFQTWAWKQSISLCFIQPNIT